MLKSNEKREKELSIIIVNYNAKAYLLKTLESIKQNLGNLDYEIIVVDNASHDGSVESIKERYPSVKRIALSDNTGFAKANNEGIKCASGHYLLILNNDTFVPEGAVEKLVEIKKRHPEYGIIAPLILNPNNSFQLSFGRDLHLFSEMFLKFFAERWYRLYFKLKKGKVNRNVDWVSGACFLIERKLYEQLKGFDENFFIYKEDADLGKRIRHLRYQVHFTSESRIIHYLAQSASRYPRLSLLEAKRSQLYYYCKHNSRLALKILRIYLLIRFRFKHLIFSLVRDSEGRDICMDMLRLIREFSCEDYS